MNDTIKSWEQKQKMLIITYDLEQSIHYVIEDLIFKNK